MMHPTTAAFIERKEEIEKMKIEFWRQYDVLSVMIKFRRIPVISGVYKKLSDRITTLAQEIEIAEVMCREGIADYKQQIANEEYLQEAWKNGDVA